MSVEQARFHIGQLVHHRLFDYRGVIYAVDQQFEGDETWYRAMALTRPPRDKPWYHVLVHGAAHTTYVAERNLEADDSSEPVEHPLVDELFAGFKDGRYIAPHTYN